MYCTSVYIKDKEAVVVCVYVCVCVWDSIFVYTGRKELLDLTQKAKAEIGAVRPAASASRTGPKEHIPPPRPQWNRWRELRLARARAGVRCQHPFKSCFGEGQGLLSTVHGARPQAKLEVRVNLGLP